MKKGFNAMNKLLACRSNFEVCYEFAVDGKVVGGCTVTRSNYIHSLEIEEGYRNRGYARMMLKEIMKMYPGQRLWLRVWATNIPAIKAYTAVGFTVFERGPYDQFNSEEVVSMEITLPAKEISFKKRYGLMLVDEDYKCLFDSEEERNEVALAWYEELAPALWARTFNLHTDYDKYNEDDLFDEARYAHDNIMDDIHCYEEIVMEEV